MKDLGQHKRNESPLAIVSLWPFQIERSAEHAIFYIFGYVPARSGANFSKRWLRGFFASIVIFSFSSYLELRTSTSVPQTTSKRPKSARKQASQTFSSLHADDRLTASPAWIWAALMHVYNPRAVREKVIPEIPPTMDDFHSMNTLYCQRQPSMILLSGR